jgi:hypothetical protein
MQLKNYSAIIINTNTTALWIITDLPLYNIFFYALQTFSSGNLNRHCSVTIFLFIFNTKFAYKAVAVSYVHIFRNLYLSAADVTSMLGIHTVTMKLLALSYIELLWNSLAVFHDP